MNARHDENGVTLLEICFALVIIGLVVSAFMATLISSTRASVQHRQLVTADTVLRSYAETVKSQVRQSCGAGASTWSAPFSAPSGFSVNALANQPCPPTTGAISGQVLTVTLVATEPSGVTQQLALGVRSP
jgi:type II secretory pathway pseudopilin PulG